MWLGYSGNCPFHLKAWLYSIFLLYSKPYSQPLLSKFGKDSSSSQCEIYSANTKELRHFLVCWSSKLRVWIDVFNFLTHISLSLKAICVLFSGRFNSFLLRIMLIPEPSTTPWPQLSGEHIRDSLLIVFLLSTNNWSLALQCSLPYSKGIDAILTSMFNRLHCFFGSYCFQTCGSYYILQIS